MAEFRVAGQYRDGLLDLPLDAVGGVQIVLRDKLGVMYNDCTVQDI